MAPDFLTLRSTLERAAAMAPSRGITIFNKRGSKVVRRSYPEVLASASQIARRWRAAGISKGDRVLIARPTSWEWVDSWLGALLARAIPAAAPPGGGFGNGRSDIDRVACMAEKLDCKFALVSESFRSDAIALGLRMLADRAITFEELTSVPPASSIPDDDDPSPIAFLQFTSGTEGFPRAVGISDRAAINNSLALNEAILAPLETRQIDAIVSWLPLHHDMGLVGGFLHAISTGRDLVLLPPQAFLARPRQWLNEIGNHSSALSLSPAFGFRYCADRLAGQTSDLNLTGWRAALCGAETIPPLTIAEFMSAFASANFRAEAFRAGYGLAEATVAVTLDRKGKGARTRPVPAGSRRKREVQEAVCLGEPVADTEIRCAGPNGVERREDQIGEILVRGPALFTGYFDDRTATQAAFHQGWLRTGDLGFIHSRELYLTGRLKDVLIIRGENFMPQQLERVAEGIFGGTARAAAFSVGTARDCERAVLLVETPQQDRERIAETSSEIRSRIGDAFGLQLADLVFLRRGSLPTTSSGKLRRGEAQAQYLAGRLQGVES